MQAGVIIGLMCGMAQSNSLGSDTLKEFAANTKNPFHRINATYSSRPVSSIGNLPPGLAEIIRTADSHNVLNTSMSPYPPNLTRRSEIVSEMSRGTGPVQQFVAVLGAVLLLAFAPAGALYHIGTREAQLQGVRRLFPRLQRQNPQ